MRLECFLAGVLTASMGALAMAADTSVQTNAVFALAGKRIALLGDSLTDGGAWPLLVSQALKQAGKTPPTSLISSIGILPITA